MDKFGKKWQSRFSKRNTIPTQIGGYTDSYDIANCFQQAFSECCFDSYGDTAHVVELNVKIANADSNLTNNTFSVVDVETGFREAKNWQVPWC